MLGHSDQSGYFNVIVRQGDTVEFIQIEQKPVRHIVPDTLTNSRYHVITTYTTHHLYPGNAVEIVVRQYICKARNCLR
jgi:hypothetical protein